MLSLSERGLGTEFAGRAAQEGAGLLFHKARQEKPSASQLPGGRAGLLGTWPPLDLAFPRNGAAPKGLTGQRCAMCFCWKTLFLLDQETTLGALATQIKRLLRFIRDRDEV